jgi:hypothetical protein
MPAVLLGVPRVAQIWKPTRDVLFTTLSPRVLPMKQAVLVTAVVCLASVTAARVQAQLTGVHFNIGAGATVPTSDFGNHTDIGYNLVAGLGIPQAGSPIGFRIEGTYNEFAVSNNSNRIFGSDTKSRAAGVTLNATFDFNVPRPGAGSSNTLYAIGGAGYYSARDALFTDQNDGNFGWNLGGGFRFPLTGFSAYIEARYNSISNTSIRFVPITFGLAF